MPDRNRIIDQFFGDAATAIQWADEAEKRLHFWHDDLHCPQPISPMWFDVGGWWLTCGYMFRRFGVPFGKEWVAKTINEYVMSAVVPRDPQEEAELAPYFQMEPYKGHWGWPEIYTRDKEAAPQPNGTIRGLAASAGVVEGAARIVTSPEQFDQVRQGEVPLCKMTNPAWVVLFTKISGLITDSGGALSHPAVVSREFGIPAVVGTGVASQKIQTGQRVRVNGAAGLVEILA
jgi:phosphoenolpyruvate synthase/pyruvate phosphate dikinase